MRVGLSVPIMDEPTVLVDLGVAAESNGATWVLVTGWLDELRGLAGAPAPGSSVG